MKGIREKIATLLSFFYITTLHPHKNSSPPNAPKSMDDNMVGQG